LQTYWKLDNWEDDMRRRRRFVKNPQGSSHLEATLKAAMDQNYLDAINNRDEVIKQLQASNKRFMSDFANANPVASDQLHINEAELEQELTGPIHFTTKCKLVCCVCVVGGTLSVTSNELYFEVDENDSTYKTLEPNVSYKNNILL
jgi:hypothetical protein